MPRPVHPRFGAPPEKTSTPASLYLHRRHVTFWGIRERERETGREIFKHEGRGRGGDGGARGKVYSKPTRVDATSDDQMMMISIVLFKKQTELSSMYLEEGTYLGDTRQDSHPSHRRRSSMGGRAILFSTWVPWQSFKTAHSMQARTHGRCSSTPLTVASWEPLMPRRLW